MVQPDSRPCNRNCVNRCVWNQKLHRHQQLQHRVGIGTAEWGATACRLVGVKRLIFVAGFFGGTKEVLSIQQEEDWTYQENRKQEGNPTDRSVTRTQFTNADNSVAWGGSPWQRDSPQSRFLRGSSSLAAARDRDRSIPSDSEATQRRDWTCGWMVYTPKLKFTLEKEVEQKINFLDLTIQREHKSFSIDI